MNSDKGGALQHSSSDIVASLTPTKSPRFEHWAILSFTKHIFHVERAIISGYHFQKCNVAVLAEKYFNTTKTTTLRQSLEGGQHSKAAWPNPTQGQTNLPQAIEHWSLCWSLGKASLPEASRYIYRSRYIYIYMNLLRGRGQRTVSVAPAVLNTEGEYEWGGARSEASIFFTFCSCACSPFPAFACPEQLDVWMQTEWERGGCIFNHSVRTNELI